MKKAALYIRVSTSHQVDKDSLPFQREELSNYSKYVLGIDDFVVFEDAGYSAKNTDRPKYQEMISRIKNHEFSHLLVWKIDRISRNLKDFTEMYDDLKEQGITFISKNEQFDTSSAMGEAMLKIILVFAELERKLTGERVFSIMLSRAEKGLWNGATVPYGFKWSEETKFPIEDENESKYVKHIYNLYEKVQSTTKVAHELNNNHIPTKRDGKWTAKTIRDILRNPFYIGTYRYNVKNNQLNKYKDKSEWIVIENNHPNIIEKAQFEKVGLILSNNYRGDTSKQRRNSNVHILSQLLICNNCGLNLVAALDSARKDGYRPSRYTCASKYTVDNIHNCNNYVSDITLLPFLLNYVSNFINLQNRISDKHSLRDIERILLRGKVFSNISHIDKKGLEDTYMAFVIGFDNTTFETSSSESYTRDIEIESLVSEKKKFEKALGRLEDLFLFSEDSMSKKDFLFKKRDLTENLNRINEQLSDMHQKELNKTIKNDTLFINKASHFLISKHLTEKKNIDYRDLLDATDPSIVKDFVSTVVDQIIISEKRITEIKFKNGITHKFLYKEIQKQSNKPRARFHYRIYEPDIINYLSIHDSITRADVEEITGLGRTGAGSILKELVDRNLLIKKGNSVAIKYFLNEEVL